MKINGKVLLKEAGSLLILVVAGAIYALGINLFLSPNKITPGGFAGVSIILNHLYGLPMGQVLLALNVPLLLFSVPRLGWRLIAKTLFSTAVMSFWIDLFAQFSSFTDEPLVASLYGGVLTGTGLGLMLAAGSTSGGSDILAYLIRKLFKMIPLSRILLGIDVVVIATSAIVFQNVEVALYAGVAKVLCTKVIDAVLSGFNYAKTVMIVTEKPQEITRCVFKFLKHGVTKIEAQGMYTGQAKTLLMVVVKRHEIYTLKKIVQRIDPKCFMVVSDSAEVIGRGFLIEEASKRRAPKRA